MVLGFLDGISDQDNWQPTGNSIFPFENQNQWESEVQNKISVVWPAKLNFNPSLYQDISTDVSVSDAHICRKGHRSKKPLQGHFFHLTIGYSILEK